MRLHLRIVVITASIFILGSCSWLESDTDLSSSPYFSSLTFTADDDIPGLEDADFTLEWDDLVGDSVIVNLDSLPYQTDISAVIATFSFASTGGAYVCMTNTDGTGIDTLDISTMTDTLNFNKVVSITNIAADKIAEHQKTYPIKINVHQVDPELYDWKKLSSVIYGDGISVTNQKAVYFHDSIFLYLNNIFSSYLYTSYDGQNWQQKNLTGFPTEPNVQKLYVYKDNMYLMQDEAIYTSQNGINWIALDYSSKDYTFINFLFELNNEAWAITQSKVDDKYRFAKSTDGATWYIQGELPDNFPLGDFAATSFKSRTNQSRAIVAGGYGYSSTSGNIALLDNVWSTENGYYWVDFSQENKTFGKRAGAAIINYDNKLLLFGGIDDEGITATDNLLQSIDEGFSWEVTDTTQNRLREIVQTPVQVSADSTRIDTTYINYLKRGYQSVLYIKREDPTLLFSQHYIYLIGGRNNSTVYQDVWRGRLNRLAFIRQDD